jgi:integrase
MGKVVVFKRKVVEQVRLCEVCSAIEIWLQTKPFNTKRQYLSVCKDWSKALGCEWGTIIAGTCWLKASVTDTQRFINDQLKPDRKRKISKASVKQKAIVLKSVYDRLIVAELAIRNPWVPVLDDMQKWKGGDLRPHQPLPMTIVKKLLKVRDHQDNAIMHCLLGAALRRSEATNLQVGDVIIGKHKTVILRLRDTKAQKSQQVELADWVGEVVLGWKHERIDQGARQEDALFVRCTKKNCYQIGEKYIYRMFKKYLQQLKIEQQFSPHCCRVTAITQMLDQGFSHREVQKLSRHSSVTMVEKYDRARIEEGQSPTKKLSYDDK